MSDTPPIEFRIGAWQVPPEEVPKWKLRGVVTFVGHVDFGGRLSKFEWERLVAERGGKFITYPGADVAEEGKQFGRVGFLQLDEPDLPNHVDKPGYTPAALKAQHEKTKLTGLPMYLTAGAMDNEWYDGFPKPQKTDGSKYGHRAATGGWFAYADIVGFDFYLYTHNRGVAQYPVIERCLDRCHEWSGGKPIYLFVETCTQGKGSGMTVAQWEDQVFHAANYCKAKGYKLAALFYFSHIVFPNWKAFDGTSQEISDRMPAVNAKLMEMFKGTAPTPPTPIPIPIPIPDPRDAQIDTLTKQLAAEKAARDAAEKVASTAMATADKASASLAESKAVISESATAAVALVEVLTGAPAIPAPSLPKPVIFTGRPYPDDNTGLPSCNFANFGWIVPNGNIYAATKEQVQAFARAVAEGKPHLEVHGNKLRPTAKGGPIIFEFEGCWDPKFEKNPMRDKEDFPANWTHVDVSAHFANLMRWVREPAPGVLIGCYGYPYGVEYQILAEFPINNAPDLFRAVHELTDFTQGQFYVPSNDPKAYEDCRVLVMGLSDTIKRRYPKKPHFVWVNPQTVGNPLEDLTPATVAKFVPHTDEMCRGIEPGQPMGAKVIFTDDFAKWRRVMGPT